MDIAGTGDVRKRSGSQARSARAATIDLAGTVADELAVTGRYGQLGNVSLIGTVFHTESVITFDEVGTHITCTCRSPVGWSPGIAAPN